MHGCNIFNKATQSFKKFIDYLALVPQQKMGLTDHKFETTTQFIAYAEIGLRNFAMSSNRPLGKHAMRSPKDWELVHKWKKRETWVHVGLSILRTGSLSRWTSFKWSDHLLLAALHRVFKKKILPMTNGDASSLFGDIIKDPDTWDEPKRKESKKSPSQKQMVSTSQTPQSSQTHFVCLVSSDDEVCRSLLRMIHPFSTYDLPVFHS